MLFVVGHLFQRLFFLRPGESYLVCVCVFVTVFFRPRRTEQPCLCLLRFNCTFLGAPQMVFLNILQYRQNIFWIPKKCSCAEKVVKRRVISREICRGRSDSPCVSVTDWYHLPPPITIPHYFIALTTQQKLTPRSTEGRPHMQACACSQSKLVI